MELNEKSGWQRWTMEHPQESAGLLKRLWEASGSYKNSYQPNLNTGLAALKNRMNQHQPAKLVRMSPQRIALRVAAGIAFLAVTVMVFRSQLATQDKLSVVSTPTDITKEIAFADGSTVTLNQSSQLSYKTEFARIERRVRLQGEAFFQVARDENRPFIIETEVGEIQVLGTSFNLRSYPDDDFFEVYVESGKVKVNIKNADQSAELTKGEYFRFTKSNNKAVKGVDNLGIPVAWRTGLISFKGQTMLQVLGGMERLFGVSIDLLSNQNTNCLQTLTVEKGKLDEAIAALKTSCPTLNFTKKTTGGYTVHGVCCE